MNILVTGGYGFIGSFIAERFYKENHSIFILDNLSSGKKGHVDFKHKSIIANIEDEQCEQFFKSHSFDVVIHCAAQTHVQQSIDQPLVDSSTNILGLINMLNLSKKYGVKKFVFSSSAAIYGNNLNLPLKEVEEAKPISPYGMNKMIGETYCEKWGEMYGLSSLIFRFSNVYGPRQDRSEESGVIAIFTNHMIVNQPLIIYGDGEQTRDFIYVGDVAEAIYRGVISNLSGTYNLSSNTETSINSLIDILSEFHSTPEIKRMASRSSDILQSRLDNTAIKSDLDWVPKYTLHEGINKTLSYYENHLFEPIEEGTVKPDTGKSPLLAFFENMVLFLIFLAATSFLSPVVETVDIWLIYILLAALLFGKMQTIIASILAIGVNVFVLASQGREWTSLLVDNSVLATFTIYLLVGLVVSYVVDRRKIESQFTQDELESSQSKYQFLSTIYEDTRVIKEQLHEQILRSEDGIGKVYQATKELESLEPEALFKGAIRVLEQTLNARQVVIYLVNPNGYLRLAAKSGDEGFYPGSSIRIPSDSLIEQAITSKQIKYNVGLHLNEPLFVSPIVQNGNTVAVIVCYQVEFDRITLSYRNLVDVVSRLISASLGQAYDYVNEISHERYVEGTTALKPVYFQRILDNKRKSFSELHIPFVKLEVLSNAYTPDMLRQIGALLRTNDYLGFDDKDQLYILLSNAKRNDAHFVMERLQSKGLMTKPDEENVLYGT
ncbi:NAD-dependent epimerase/dehydratase family protein [Paenisporosarcina macmurdoensis]|uniref:NAD-dependent epimerase/dehydratase family protein n=1 Tax=Paenisporosarcina macmurdoensis TaxID=212659 RepID=A0ABW1L7D4_9BACL